MSDKKEKIAEFRYYEMPLGRYDLALLGDKWVTTYCTGEQHFHNYFEISYCYYGKGQVFLGEDSVPYKDGTITLIPRNFPHGIHSAKGNICKWEFLYIDLIGFIEKCYEKDPHLKAQILKNITRMPLAVSKEDYPYLFHAIWGILEENRIQKSLYKDAILGYLYILVQELVRLNETIGLQTSAEVLHIEKIRPALTFAEANYKEEIKIEQLAMACNISVPYFRRLFVDCMHTSPLEYIHTLRIQKACEILQKEDIAIHTLAWKVGFTSVSAFERNFKKIVGQTPKQWKLKGAKDKEFVSYQTKVLRGWTE